MVGVWGGGGVGTTVVTVVDGGVTGGVVAVGVGMTVVTVVDGVVVGMVVVVMVGVTRPKARARFCAEPDWKCAVWPAGTVPSSQNVMITGPPSISSVVA